MDAMVATPAPAAPLASTTSVTRRSTCANGVTGVTEASATTSDATPAAFPPAAATLCVIVVVAGNGLRISDVDDGGGDGGGLVDGHRDLRVKGGGLQIQWKWQCPCFGTSICSRDETLCISLLFLSASATISGQALRAGTLARRKFTSCHSGKT